nr:hypothetical protein [Tanacetum cinerariifolium]
MTQRNKTHKPPNYSKENFIATFTPQTVLSPKQVFWSKDLLKQKAKALKAKTPPLKVLPPATLYPPNNPVHLDVFYTVTNSALISSRFHDLSVAYNVAKTRAVELEAENLKLNEKIQQDDHDTMVSTSTYLNRLKDSLDTLREIVEEDRIAKSLDNVVDYACMYTKRSQEFLEYVIGTSPKVGNTRDRFIASTPLRVNSDTKASGSKPKSNTKNDRTTPTKSVYKKKVEDHLRNHKSNLNKKNRVDSSISSKRTLINLNSNALCKNCNECLISGNHDKCVEKFLKSPKKSPVEKIWRPKQVKQSWITKPKVVHIRQWKPTGRIIPLSRQSPLIRSSASTSALIVAETQAPMVPVDLDTIYSLLINFATPILKLPSENTHASSGI